MFDVDSKHQDQVDLVLTLKALPVRVDEHNAYRVKLFNFAGMQLSIISY